MEQARNIPGSGPQAAGPTADVHAIEQRLHRLERRDWSLWLTAVIVLLLLSFAIYLLSTVWAPVALDLHSVISDQHATDIGHALIATVLLFSLFALYQQYLIKRLRKQLHEQLALMLGLRCEADVLYRLAALDALTEVFNRRLGMDRMNAEISLAQRRGSNLTLVVVDLDGFKEINDTYGHQAGDLALREFAHALQKAVRNSDTICRYGGDEFFILLPDCDTEQVQAVIRRMQEVRITLGSDTFPIQFSYGIASYASPQTPEEFFANADHGAYAMKNARKANPAAAAPTAAVLAVQPS